MRRPESLLAVREFIMQADVRPSTTREHLIVSPARSIGIEILLLYPMLDQIPPCGTLDGDVPSRGNVIGGDGISQGNEDTCAHDVLWWLCFRGEMGKKRRFSHVGRVWDPRIGRAGGFLHLLPLAVSQVDLGIFSCKHVLVDSCLHNMLYLRRGRPEILEEDRLTVGCVTDWLSRQVSADRTCQRIGND